MVMIQPLFTSSKWNMGEIIELKFHIFKIRASQQFFVPFSFDRALVRIQKKEPRPTTKNAEKT